MTILYMGTVGTWDDNSLYMDSWSQWGDNSSYGNSLSDKILAKLTFLCRLAKILEIIFGLKSVLSSLQTG